MKKKIQSALVLALVGLLGASTPVSVMAKESEESASAELQPMQQESSETYILDSSDAYTPYDEDILPEIAHVNIAVPYDSKTVAQWLAPYRHQDPMALDVLGFFMTQSPAPPRFWLSVSKTRLARWMIPTTPSRFRISGWRSTILISATRFGLRKVFQLLA